MMFKQGDFAFQENPEFQAVKLFYRGGLQMELFLPETNSNPATLLAGLAGNETRRADIQTGFNFREGSIILPKFKIEYQTRLNEPLQALGMKNAFAAAADFSGIANERLFISEVKQKSFVDVNEEGTEAAAVTTVTMTALAARRSPPDSFTMILDRPFFFVISDVSTGSILFMGVVNDPASGN